MYLLPLLQRQKTGLDHLQELILSTCYGKDECVPMFVVVHVQGREHVYQESMTETVNYVDYPSTHTFVLVHVYSIKVG